MTYWCKHSCPRCSRRWEHDNDGPGQVHGQWPPSPDMPCVECTGGRGYLYYMEHFIDDFKEWAREVRRKAEVRNGR